MVLRLGVWEHQEEHGHKPWHFYDRGKKEVSPNRLVLQRVKRGQADAGNGETEEVICALLSGDWLNVKSLCDTLVSQMTKMFSISDVAALGPCSVVCFYGKFKVLSFVLVTFLLGILLHLWRPCDCYNRSYVCKYSFNSCPVVLNFINWPDLQWSLWLQSLGKCWKLLQIS